MSASEGWAAGLQIAAMSLLKQPEAAQFVRAFAGSNRNILDYLLEEILLQQSEERQSFLLQTSILDQLSGAACDAVTGRTDSQAVQFSHWRRWPQVRQRTVQRGQPIGKPHRRIKNTDADVVNSERLFFQYLLQVSDPGLDDALGLHRPPSLLNYYISFSQVTTCRYGPARPRGLFPDTPR